MQFTISASKSLLANITYILGITIGENGKITDSCQRYIETEQINNWNQIHMNLFPVNVEIVIAIPYNVNCEFCDCMELVNY